MPTPAYRPLDWLGSSRLFWGAFAVMAAIRLVTIAWRDLVPDEAVYWVWSQHLDIGYRDHPPMVAWIIFVGTSAFGHAEWAVRLVGWGMALTSALFIREAARALGHGDARAANTAGLLMILSPISALSGTVVTPDTPVIFFTAAALWSLIRVAQAAPGQARGGWLVFGVLMGLALLSKYTTAVVGLSVFLGLVLTRQGRAHLATPWPWLGAMLSLLCFLPVIVWNARHDWASFAFQANQGLGAAAKHRMWESIGEYLGSQVGLINPLLFAAFCYVAWETIRGHRERPALPNALLLWVALFHAAFFAYSSSRARVEFNWPVLTWLPALILLACHVTAAPKVWMGRLVAWGAGLALLLSLALHMAPEVALGIGVKNPKLFEVFGWRQLGEHVDNLAGDAPVVARRFRDAAIVTYYRPSKRLVYVVLPQDATTTTSWDYFAPLPDLSRFERAIFIRTDVGTVNRFFRSQSSQRHDTIMWGQVIRQTALTLARDGHSFLPQKPEDSVAGEDASLQ